MCKKMIFMSVILVAVTGCGGGGSNNANAGGATTGDTTAGDTTTEGATTVLEGTWIKPCSIGTGESPLDPNAFYDVITAVFAGNSQSSNIKNYADSACTVPFDIAPNPTADGVFSIGDTLTTTSGIQATAIDSQITQFNGADFDVVDFDLFYIDGDTVYFGLETGDKDRSTSTLRPDRLDFDRGFLRQP